MRTIGENVRAFREERGWTQEELSKMAGIGEKYISAIERGRRSPGHKIMTELCNAFNVTEMELRFGHADDNGLDRRHGEALRKIYELLSPLPEVGQWGWHLRILQEQEEKKK